MKIVTDSAANLTSEQCETMGVGLVRFRITFNGITYIDGTDITPEAIYQLYLKHPDEYPFTSQPSAGEFAEMYAQYPDEEIISINLSSGLSGTYSSAKTAADMIPGERVTVVDLKTIGPGLGWMVERRRARRAPGMDQSAYFRGYPTGASKDIHYRRIYGYTLPGSQRASQPPARDHRFDTADQTADRLE